MAKFTKTFLTNVLKMDEENVKAVMKYQRMFPSLLTEEEGVCVDARKLWKELGEPQSEFNKWIKRKVIDKRFQENEDYIKIDNFVEVGNLKRPQIDYTLTIDCAKNVSMMENTEKGSKVRNYFMITEKALKGLQEHLIIRHPEKEGYKEMTKELDEKFKIKFNCKTPPKEYIKNAEMINTLLFNKTAKQIKETFLISDNQTRENLIIEANKAIYELQVINTSLIRADINFETRKSILQTTVIEKYSHLKNDFIKIENMKNII
jgi:phage anti-repressor protein